LHDLVAFFVDSNLFYFKNGKLGIELKNLLSTTNGKNIHLGLNFEIILF